MGLTTWLILLTIPVLVAWGTRRVFRHGARQRFISEFPLGTLALWSFGFQLFSRLLDWLFGKPVKSISSQATTAAIIFGMASLVWLIGFLFGRWRSSRREGVLGR